MGQSREPQSAGAGAATPPPLATLRAPVTSAPNCRENGRGAPGRWQSLQEPGPARLQAPGLQVARPWRPRRGATLPLRASEWIWIGLQLRAWSSSCRRPMRLPSKVTPCAGARGRRITYKLKSLGHHKSLGPAQTSLTIGPDTPATTRPRTSGPKSSLPQLRNLTSNPLGRASQESWCNFWVLVLCTLLPTPGIAPYCPFPVHISPLTKEAAFSPDYSGKEPRAGYQPDQGQGPRG